MKSDKLISVLSALANNLMKLPLDEVEKCCGCCCLGVACCNISDQTGVYDPVQEDVQYQDSLQME